MHQCISAVTLTQVAVHVVELYIQTEAQSIYSAIHTAHLYLIIPCTLQAISFHSDIRERCSKNKFTLNEVFGAGCVVVTTCESSAGCDVCEESSISNASPESEQEHNKLEVATKQKCVYEVSNWWSQCSCGQHHVVTPVFTTEEEKGPATMWCWPLFHFNSILILFGLIASPNYWLRFIKQIMGSGSWTLCGLLKVQWLRFRWKGSIGRN